jgi:hypothetical protein
MTGERPILRKPLICSGHTVEEVHFDPRAKRSLVLLTTGPGGLSHNPANAVFAFSIAHSDDGAAKVEAVQYLGYEDEIFTPPLDLSDFEELDIMLWVIHRAYYEAGLPYYLRLTGGQNRRVP